MKVNDQTVEWCLFRVRKTAATEPVPYQSWETLIKLIFLTCWPGDDGTDVRVRTEMMVIAASCVI